MKILHFLKLSGVKGLSRPHSLAALIPYLDIHREVASKGPQIATPSHYVGSQWPNPSFNCLGLETVRALSTFLPSYWIFPSFAIIRDCVLGNMNPLCSYRRIKLFISIVMIVRAR